ncbi:MAG: glycerate kinase type-2 family protein [Paracoccaceae bacterium]
MRPDPRRQAQEIFAAGLAAADPARAVKQALASAPIAPALILAIGKGARLMAKAAQEQIKAAGHAPAPTLIVTNYENARPLKGAELLAAGHPIPDENGARAAKRLIQALHALPEDAVVLALISGGGSALLPAPPPGITLADKAELNRLLLGSGAPIEAMNLVRQQVSLIKGGGLLRLAAPAQIQALILSDVIGNDLRAIASGPTTAPIGSRKDACQLLENAGLWAQLPASIAAHLSAEQPAHKPLPKAQNILIGSNELSVAAMAKAAPGAHIAPKPLIGDVGHAAQDILNLRAPGIYLFGGETTVELRGSGLGGRNQELALRIALGAQKAGWGTFTFLSGGTDGRDGPTDAAGGIVDAGSLERMRARGIDPIASLQNNDSYHALKASDDLLMIGATGTNVADLQVLILE